MTTVQSGDSASAPADLFASQRWFMAVITNPHGVDAGAESPEARLASDQAIGQVITSSRRLPAEERLAIYSRAYVARLIECLGDSFPALKRALGEDLFNGFAAAYLDRHPSRSYTLCRLGDRFADYLVETRPTDTPDVAWPDLLIDLARLEWTIDEVFDGPGIEDRRTLQAEDLLGIPPERLPEIRLKTAPCFRLLRFRFPVNGYYTALRRAEGEVTHAPPPPGESFMAVTRRDFVVRRHELSRTQFELLAHLQRGETIRDAIAHAAQSCGFDDETFAQRLHEWFRLWAKLQFFESLTA